MPTIEIRRFVGNQRAELRRIRLQGLAECPLAFASTFEHEMAQGDRFWDGWLAANPPFGAFDGSTAVGIASLSQGTLPNLVHRGTLGAMFVAPEQRGRGAARRLVEAVLEQARGQRIELVTLTVTAGNVRAERFYQHLGFERYGIERHGMKYDGRYCDLILMSRRLAT